MNKEVEKCKKHLEELAQEGFYGHVTYKFKDGEVYHVEVHKSYKTYNLPVEDKYEQ